MTKSNTGVALLALCLIFVTFGQAAERSKRVANLQSGKQQTIVTYGTSLTAGGAWVKQLQQSFNSSYPGKTKVINSGMSGKWSATGVKHLDKRVIQKKPDAVLIEFAINELFVEGLSPILGLECFSRSAPTLSAWSTFFRSSSSVTVSRNPPFF